MKATARHAPVDDDDDEGDPDSVQNHRFGDFEFLTPALLKKLVHPGDKFTIVWGQTWQDEDKTGNQSLATITYDGIGGDVGRSNTHRDKLYNLMYRDKLYIRGQLQQVGYGSFGPSRKRRKLDEQSGVPPPTTTETELDEVLITANDEDDNFSTGTGSDPVYILTRTNPHFNYPLPVFPTDEQDNLYDAGTVMLGNDQHPWVIKAAKGGRQFWSRVAAGADAI